jgi:hypothetical protein
MTNQAIGSKKALQVGWQCHALIVRQKAHANALFFAHAASSGPACDIFSYFVYAQMAGEPDTKARNL